jgi:hypothetical protein
MRELELAGHPSIYATRALGGERRAQFPLSRMAFGASIVVHVLVGYALSRTEWPTSPPAPQPLAEFFLFEMPRPAAAPESVPAPAPIVSPPEVREPPRAAEPPAPAPRPAEPIEPPAPAIAPTEVPPVSTTPVRPIPSSDDLTEARQRAANEVVTEGAAEPEYLTFSMDDVAPPRPEADPEPKRSIFDGAGGGPSGPSVGQLGQSRTKVGAKLASLCNALTSGGFSLMGWGSFCAGPSDGGPSGLFPEVRPAYLDLMPECVDTRDTAPALALEAPFSTVKCRLVKQDDAEGQP